MGDYKVFWVTTGLFFLMGATEGLNSKLDFGDDSKPSIVSNQQRNIPFKYDQVHAATKKNDALDKIGVVCTTNCDVNVKDTGTATLETDVVVSIKSSLNSGNSTKKVEEVPDVPVVLGTKGVGVKEVQRGLQFQPVSRNFQVNDVQLTPINIQNAFPTLMPLVPININEVQNRHGMRIFPAGVVSLPDGYKYRTNGMEIKIPYFEPTYHKHYYGENSPPQYAYYQTKKSYRNPVAFNNIARPAYAFHSRNAPSQNRRHDESCSCDNHGTSGLTWYPSASTHVQKVAQRRNIETKVTIDDKLASVN